jgi:hypothetical protein
LYSAEAKVPDRLDGLTEGMIKEKKSAPKQRGRAAQVRYLLPFAARLAESFSSENELENCCHSYRFVVTAHIDEQHNSL